MPDHLRIRLLRVTLVLVGLTFIFGVYGLGLVWPSGWVWGVGHPQHYLMMIIGVYATLGVFLLTAARDPDAHPALIWFTVWSSVVHSAIMFLLSMADPMEGGHMVGDSPALLLIAIVLAFLAPRRAQAPA